ncbi:amino acid adenylation domain-containing protein [Roseivirga sp. BDSF3-8]|uniref:non-ribosomal peptide synthetase n=1 Tax=Roseivirga sp. BDSF3-8 TaxID=3241598 RepID=UPI003531F4C3
MLNKENVKDLYPLSSQQEGILFHHLRFPESEGYFQQWHYTYNAAVPVEAAREAFEILVSRHDVLRTVFRYQNLDRPLQVVLKKWEPSYRFVDLQGEDIEDTDQHFKEFCKQDRKNLFDLGNEVPIRLSIVCYGPEKYGWLWSYHHIILDGWCMSILQKEYFTIYQSLIQGNKLEMPAPPPFSRFIKWIESQDKTESSAFWKQFLDGYTETTGLPAQHLLPVEGAYALKRSLLEFDTATSDSIKAMARQLKMTTNQLIQGIWGLLLAKLTGRNDVIFGMIVAGRPNSLPGVLSMIGLFINTIPARVNFDRSDSVGDILRSASDTFIDSLRYQYMSLVDIQGHSVLKEKLIDHVLVFGDFIAGDQMENSASAGHVSNLDKFEQTNYNLCIDCSVKQNIGLLFNYNSLVYDPAFIENVQNIFRLITEQVLHNPALPVNRLTYISEADRNLIATFNKTEREFPQDISITGYLQNHSQATPDKAALICKGETFSYRAADEKMQQYASYLSISCGVKPGQMVAVVTERSPQLFFSILSIWLCNAVYIPIDPEYPVERIAGIVNDSGAVLTIVDNAELEEALPAHLSEGSSIIHTSLIEESKHKAFTHTGFDFNQLAYVIYTSGSTGKPKGAMVEHVGMMNHMWAKVNDLSLSGESIVAQNASQCFDISIWQLFSAIVTGGTTIIYSKDQILNPEGFIRQVIVDQVTILEVVPSYLNVLIALFEENKKLPLPEKLLNLVTTGETVKPETVNRWFKQFPQIPMINAYGPTEASDDITHHIMTQPPEGRIVPIGMPVQNFNLYVVDQDMNPCPIGIKGEVVVSGIGVGQGYLHDPGKTAAVFMNDPFITDREVRMYKTGDLGSWTTEGTLLFYGRKDYQLKIKGFRIEPEEIEITMVEHPSVDQAVVIDYKNDRGEAYLAGYYTSASSLTYNELRTYLAAKLPAYMVPAYLVELEAIPLNSNGKTDRNKLRETQKPVQQTTSAEAYVAPEGEVEQKLAAIFSEVLELDKVSTTDNFFELGGDSFKAIRVVAKYGKGFLVPDIYANPTIEMLANFIRGNAGKENDLLYNLTGEIKQERLAIIGVPNSAGDPLSFTDTVTHLQTMVPDVSFYGTMLPREEPGEGEDMTHVLEALSEKLAEEIKTKISVPVIMFGQCNGSGLALKAARKLVEKEVPLHAVCVGGAMPRLKITPDTDARTNNDITDFVEKLGAEVPADPADKAMFLQNFRYDGLMAGTAYNGFINAIAAQEFPRFGVPFYCITGDSDPLTKPYKKRYKQWFDYADNVGLMEIKKVGHYLLRDVPEDLARIFADIATDQQSSYNITGKADNIFTKVKAALLD